MSELRTMTLNGTRYDGFVDNVARSQLAATVVVNSASGNNIVLSDASNFDVVGLKVFGKTTQDGTPTPDNPVELISTGSTGGITVNVVGENADNSMTISTPNGLPGIPVTSGGNYTDANGQQWICDEIDLTRGVYVRRIGKVDMGALSWLLYKDSVFVSTDNIIPDRDGIDIDTDLMCSIYAPDTKASDWQYVSNNGVLLRKGAMVANTYSVCVKDTRYTTASEFTDAVLGVQLFYVLATPTETPLSVEEQNAYAALHTYKEFTTVSNDGLAYMELEYVMDAKKYIDSRVTGGMVPATVE